MCPRGTAHLATLKSKDTAEIETGMAEKSSLGTRETDSKNLVWFGEIERKFSQLSMPTFTYRSSSYLYFAFFSLYMSVPRLLTPSPPPPRRVNFNGMSE